MFLVFYGKFLACYLSMSYRKIDEKKPSDLGRHVMEHNLHLFIFKFDKYSSLCFHNLPFSRNKYQQSNVFI